MMKHHHSNKCVYQKSDLAFTRRITNNLLSTTTCSFTPFSFFLNSTQPESSKTNNLTPALKLSLENDRCSPSWTKSLTSSLSQSGDLKDPLSSTLP